MDNLSKAQLHLITWKTISSLMAQIRRVKEVGLFILEKGSHEGDLTAIFKSCRVEWRESSLLKGTVKKLEIGHKLKFRRVEYVNNQESGCVVLYRLLSICPWRSSNSSWTKLNNWSEFSFHPIWSWWLVYISPEISSNLNDLTNQISPEGTGSLGHFTLP